MEGIKKSFVNIELMLRLFFVSIFFPNFIGGESPHGLTLATHTTMIVTMMKQANNHDMKWQLFNVVKLVVVGDHEEHTIDFVKTENHHANRTNDSHYQDFSTMSKKHNLG